MRKTTQSPRSARSSVADQERRQATQDLLRRAQTTNKNARRTCEDEVVRLNMGIARDIARRYRGRGVPIEDLEQVAFLGLVKAVRGFNPDLGSDFLSYAVPTARGEIRRYFRDFGWAVRPPRSVQEMQAQIAAADAELSQALHRSPRAEEIAEHLDADLDQVLDALAASGCFAPTSLDVDRDGDEAGRLADRLGEADPGFDRAEARLVLGSVVRGLGERDLRILELRFFHGCTQAEIGKDVGVTQMQVSRLLARILSDLRKAVTSQAQAQETALTV